MCVCMCVCVFVSIYIYVCVCVCVFVCNQRYFKYIVIKVNYRPITIEYNIIIHIDLIWGRVGGGGTSDNKV